MTKIERRARNKVMKARWLMYEAIVDYDEANEHWYLINGTYYAYEDIEEYEHTALNDALRARDKLELAKIRYDWALKKLREATRYKRCNY